VGDIVNATAKAAFHWQLPVVWIRVNIGYMLVETDDMAKERHQVADVQALLARFDDAYSAFARAELAVFKAARRAELQPSQPPRALSQALQLMGNGFLPWLDELKSVVTDRERAAPDGALMLLHSMGAEILKAYGEFREVVDGYGAQLAA
jgi:hypothetical protein